MQLFAEQPPKMGADHNPFESHRLFVNTCRPHGGAGSGDQRSGAIARDAARTAQTDPTGQNHLLTFFYLSLPTFKTLLDSCVFFSLKILTNSQCACTCRLRTASHAFERDDALSYEDSAHVEKAPD